MVFRKAISDDIDKIVKNRVELVPQMVKYEIPECFEKNTSEYIKSHFDDGSMIIWLAEENSEIISLAILCIYDVMPVPSNVTGKNGLLLNVSTDERYRRQGLATKLIDNIISDAKAMGVGKITLTATEMGKFVYEKMGFKQLPNDMSLKI